MKRQAIDWEKLFVRCISDKKMCLKIVKNSQHLRKSSFKRGKYFNGHLTKNDR